MVTFLAWLNVFLAFVMVSVYILRRVQRLRKKKAGPGMKKFTILLAKIHPVVGMALIASGLLHGYLALRIFYLHTGYLLWFAIVAMLLIRLVGVLTKSRNWIRIHRFGALVVVAGLLVHIFARNII